MEEDSVLHPEEGHAGVVDLEEFAGAVEEAEEEDNTLTLYSYDCYI